MRTTEQEYDDARYTSTRLNHRKQVSQRGHTLIELTIVVLVMGIAAAVAAPSFLQATSAYRSEAAAKRVAADLNYARAYAVRTSTAVTVVFDAGDSHYLLSGIPDIDNPQHTFSVHLLKTAYPASVVTVNFGGDQTVIFDIYGRPDSAGSVVLTSGGQQNTVLLDAVTGVSTVQ